MFKYILACVFCLGLVLLSPTEALAHNEEADTLRHAYKPVQVEDTNAIRARVNNMERMDVNRLVCVEAFNVKNNVKTHIGCINAKLGAHQVSTNWGFEFDAPLNTVKSGNYKVVYTFQATDGSWHKVRSMNLKVQDGMVSLR